VTEVQYKVDKYGMFYAIPIKDDVEDDTIVDAVFEPIQNSPECPAVFDKEPEMEQCEDNMPVNAFKIKTPKMKKIKVSKPKKVKLVATSKPKQKRTESIDTYIKRMNKKASL